jgi:hypothetical protein
MYVTAYCVYLVRCSVREIPGKTLSQLLAKIFEMAWPRMNITSRATAPFSTICSNRQIQRDNYASYKFILLG